MKKLLTLFLVVFVVISLFSCGNKANLEDNEQTIDQSEIGSSELDKQDEQSKYEYTGREMYEAIIGAFYEIDDELSRGWFDIDAQEFVKLIKGNHVSDDAGVLDLLDTYKTFDDDIKHADFSIRDFFTVTSSGESTNAGIYNFFETVDQLEAESFDGKDIVTVTTKGGISRFDFNLAGGNDVVADALGISEELVNIMLHAATDAGFTINFD